jgi:ketol-acid reductoisomerase
LIKSGFEVLVENGLPPENAYLETAYQLDLIIQLIKRYGIEGMLKRISVAARFGAVEAGPKIIDISVKKRMQEVMENITSGNFPARLNRLSSEDITRLKRSLNNLSHPLFEKYTKKYNR